MDRIEVVNKNMAKVFIKGSIPQGVSNNDTQQDSKPSSTNTSEYKYFFNIGSVDSFERKLEEAQESLGIDPHAYVPVIFVEELGWQQELMRLAPTVLLIAGFIYLSRRMQSGLGMGSSGGGLGGGLGGARGLFTVGKARVTKLSKNAKDKVFIKHYVYVC